MAIARVQSKTATNNAATSLAITLDSTPTEGNIVILAIGAGSLIEIPPAGNIEWLLFQTVQSSTRFNAIAVGRVLGSPSATITVTQASSLGFSIVGAEYSGVSQRWDRQQVGRATTGTSIASGATATTGTASQLWVGSLFAGAARPTSATFYSSPTNSFSIVAEVQTTLNTTGDKTVALTELIASSTGTANTGATALISGVWLANVLTLEAASAASGGIIVPLTRHGVSGVQSF